MKVAFYVMHNYYWPHFEPVINELVSRNCAVIIGFSQQPSDQFIEKLESYQGLQYKVSKDNNMGQWYQYFNQFSPQWLFFGNATSTLEGLDKNTKTALIQHGIGPKSVYYTVSDSPIKYRFVESEHRLNKLKEMFPRKVFILSGYSKLDPLVNGEISSKLVSSFDANKQTILYAPTFYPSTVDNMPDDWPEQFADYNILVKPHGFSYSKKKYQSHRDKFQKWQQYKNVYVAPAEDQDLLPYMLSADLMMSEYSSALFEFAAINKPVLICEFVKLRWSYRGIFSYRMKARVDAEFERYKSIGTKVPNFLSLLEMTQSSFNKDQNDNENRKQLINEIAGDVDGKASQRIVDYLYGETECA